jgi:hypothetical protein
VNVPGTSRRSSCNPRASDSRDGAVTKRCVARVYALVTRRRRKLSVGSTEQIGKVGGRLEIRLAGSTRVLLALYFGCVGAFVLVFVILTAIYNPSVVAIPLLVLALVGVGCWRWTRIAVIGSQAGLTVRTPFRTQQLSRTSIRAFRVGGSKWQYPGRAVRAVLEDGSTVVLVATGHFFATNEQALAWLAQLESWRLGQN